LKHLSEERCLRVNRRSVMKLSVDISRDGCQSAPSILNLTVATAPRRLTTTGQPTVDTNCALSQFAWRDTGANSIHHPDRSLRIHLVTSLPRHKVPETPREGVLKISNLVFGNPAGRKPGSRNQLSEEVICALLRDFRQHGQKAIARVRETQPGVYLKVLALLVPKQHKVEMANAITGLTDTQLDLMIEDLQRRIERRASGAKLIEAEAVEVEPQDEPDPP
jgi:hypothetical protein